MNRPNRCIVTVDINGQKESVHIMHTGRCKELLIPVYEVWLTAPGAPDRNTKSNLIAIKKSYLANDSY